MWYVAKNRRKPHESKKVVKLQCGLNVAKVD
jgi:hypothetical protein